MAIADDDDWLVADSEGDDVLLPGRDALHDLGETNLSKLTETSAIQSARFSPPRAVERSRFSPDISGASLFTPPGESGFPTDPRVGTSSPRATEEVIPAKPKPRPRPRVRMKTTETSRPTNEDSAQTSGAGVTSAFFSHISDPSTLAKSTEDSIQPATATSSSFSEILDPYSSLGIAERAKMRSRRQPSGKRPTYGPADDDVIELTSDEDELALKPTKRQKKQGKLSTEAKPQPKPRPKSRPNIKAKKMLDYQSSSAANTNLPEDPVGLASSNPPPASTTATIPPSTPPISPEASPLSSPAIIIRKRKRTRPSLSDDDTGDMDAGGNAPREPSPPVAEPTPFFAPSSSVPVSDSGVELPSVCKNSSGGQNKQQNTAKKGGRAKAQSKGRKGRGKKRQDDEVLDEPPPTGPDLSVAESASVAGEGAHGMNRASRTRKTASVEVSVQRKGKDKAVDDEGDEPALPSTAAVSPQPQVHEDEASTNAPPLDDEEPPQGTASKENMWPDEPSPTKRGTQLKTPITTVHSRALSIKPRATPMSELIRRVNSQPSSPFPSVSRPYSPWLKSSRTMLSNIAPLHPNRRPPPPPLPRPPPPKKSKKRIELEERIEEELADTVEGWSCMTDEERRDLRRARIDAELGYE